MYLINIYQSKSLKRYDNAFPSISTSSLRRSRARDSLNPPSLTQRSSLFSLRVCLRPLACSQGNDYVIPDVDDASDSTVGNKSILRIIGKSQTKGSVDRAEGHQCSAKPDVDVGRGSAPTARLVQLVMQETKRGLEDEETHRDQTNDGVVRVEKLQ